MLLTVVQTYQRLKLLTWFYLHAMLSVLPKVKLSSVEEWT